MNDHDLDALASDLLDGLLPAERSADALADPAVARRVAEMRAAQALVRDTPALDPGRREATLAAALAAADPLSPGADAPGAHDTPGAPDELASRRAGARPPHRRRRVPGWLTAAAVLLLVVALGGLVATVGGSGDDEAGTSSDAAAPATDESDDGASGDDAVAADRSGSAAGAAGDAAESSDPAAPGAPTTTAATFGADESGAPPVDLGGVASVDEIAAGVHERSALAVAPPADQETEARQADADALARFATCRPAGAEDEAGRSVSAAAVATLDGRPVTAWVVVEDGARTVIVADAGCTVVGRRPIPG